jgi:hypothetical protein
MKQGIVWGLLITMMIACQENENASAYTGNEATYELQPGSAYNISGFVTFKEMRNGEAEVVVQITGTSGDAKLPVHLHRGDIATPSAEVAALLTPVNAKTGVSETKLTQLADETKVTYSDLIQLNACIKIHLSDVGPERNIILAGGNIGESVRKGVQSGRSGLAPCKSE